METVNRAIDTASQAIWGENSSQSQLQQQQQQQHGSEPLSGVSGKGTVTDPYDAGNRDEQPAAATQTGGIDPANRPASYAASGNRNYQTSGSEYPASGVQPGDEGDASSSQKGRTTASEMDSTTTNQGSEGDNQSSENTSSEESESARQNVSKEALEGPQGPPPEHYDTNGLVGEPKKSRGVVNDGAEIRQDNPASSNKPGKGNVSGKGSKIAQLKEKLHGHI
ncbi:hypothetical protein DTO166G4_7033 [Paecilomyces variotii]|nr:hypothetical protein DTO164E3_2330 [Paecilomyces variotii]KAJ9211411.1 hypothetical protein DTO166G4_7033 [Paecilomyces variotii]KAJ9225882.1 hypothetical protein DTO169C6_1945 [Paecilomyces variotii]KAJ9233927.1 hypothetical protein DTO166G5_5419 [Paecilomyces variotii]KAJ9239707.1 hypothetical protein DTO169E5_4219 [Paecilomyces variotii]